MTWINYLDSEDVLEMLRKGIRTEHFHARISYPYGFDNPAKIEIQMTPFYAIGNDELSANQLIESTLRNELEDLTSRIDALTYDIGTFAMDRNRVRNNQDPDICHRRRSCFHKVWKKKEALA